MKKKDQLKILKELDEYKTFGKQLREAMDLHGYSRSRIQDELSEQKLYATEKEIANWENDKSYPDITTIYKLAEMLDLDPNNLLKAKQLMQEAALGSIDMLTIRVVCGVLEKSLVFAFWTGRFIFWSALIILISVSFKGLIPINIFVTIILGILFAIGMGW
jgi:transcriptional regulator with XRE-family HTH domain